MKRIKKAIMQMLTIMAGICIYSSCSGDDYINAIPGNSNALISIDGKALSKQNKQTDYSLLKSLFKVNDISECGIDLGAKLYFFETTDGNLGCCAKVDDNDKLNDWLTSLAGKGDCTKPVEKRGMTFSLIKGKWAAGFNSKSMLIIGPILPAQQADAIRSISKYLKQDEDDGVKGSPMFDRLDSIESPIAMVAQAAALPEKITGPFTIGAPKEADPSQILIAMEMEKQAGNCLTIRGETFSFNKDIDNAMKENTRKFRKINGKYINNIPGNSICAILMNAAGKDLVSMMHDNAGLGVLLTGINTAIDMDNILRSADGDLAFSIKSYSEDKIEMSMAAQLYNRNFLKDVDYWKKSCPDGSSITDCGKDTFLFRSSDTSFMFGVTEGNDFFGNTDKDEATAILAPAKAPLPATVRSVISQQRFCIVLNVNRLLAENKEISTFTDMLKPLFGEVNDIIYCIR